MSLFNSILEQLTKSLQHKAGYKDTIAAEISSLIGIEIQPDQIRVKENTVYLNISPTIKTVVLLKRSQLLIVLQKYNITTIG